MLTDVFCIRQRFLWFILLITSSFYEKNDGMTDKRGPETC